MDSRTLAGAAFFIQVVFGTLSLVEGYSYTGERSIRHSVLASITYDRMARPNATTTVKLGFNLLAINDVDLDSQSFQCTGWFTMLWTDDRLSWNPSIYDDTLYIHALETEVWKPEVLMSNSEDVGLISDDHLVYRINHDGLVEWEPLISTKMYCNLDSTYFPFDSQECSIELTSWGLPDNELKFDLLWDTVQTAEYRESTTWDFISSNVSKSTIFEDVYGTVERFSKVVFYIKVKRKSGNYAFNTLLPIICSSFLMLFTNLIPLKTGERVVSSFLVIVINSMLLTIFLQQIPDIATTTALLGIYLIGSFCIDFVRLFVTVAMAKMHHRSAEYSPVGRITTRFALIVGRLVCFKGKPPVEIDRMSLLSIPTDDLKKIEKTFPAKKNSVLPELAEQNGFTETVKVKESALPVLNAKYEINLQNAKAKLHEKSSNRLDTYSLDEFDKQPKLTWDNVATIFDRLWFIFFLVAKVVFNGILIGRLVTHEN